ncbi:unnamed protein product [Phaedon cochleariae]|uniref:Malate dehydrogenase n=1 Tax=Phaedon cochleariae TaxID=80249 RepID=A0A9N9X628_PHACE|nr:unnamed protein product [Phaedon cochleariae]
MLYHRFQTTFQSLIRSKRRNFSKCKNSSESAEKIAPLCEVERFITECMVSVGVEEPKANIFAHSLVQADSRGIHSHGLNRLENYVKDVKDKLCDANAQPTITKEAASTALVSGHNGLGAVVGKFCMDLAIDKASKTGVGLVAANGSNHFGVNLQYSMQAMEKGFIGMCFTNTSPVMVPTGAKKVALGTNPLSLAAPGECGDSFVADFATTAVSLGKIEIHKRDNKKIPEGWALNDQGKQETDPAIALKAKKLMPLGATSSYKGTGLALIVEIFCGLLADAKYGPNVRFWGQMPPEEANLGQSFLAINPENFAPGFGHRLSDLLNYIRKLEPADPKHPVMVPGDPEKLHMKIIEEQGGIIYPKSIMDVVEKLSKELCVQIIEYKTK